VNLLDALRHGATYSCFDADEDQAREAGSLLDAMYNLLAARRISTLRELNDAILAGQARKETTK